MIYIRKLLLIASFLVLGVTLYSVASKEVACAGWEKCEQEETPDPSIEPECDGECSQETPEPSATPAPTEEPSPTPPSCGADEHLDASGRKCVKWAIPESPEFFRNQGTPFPGLPGDDPSPLRGAQK